MKRSRTGSKVGFIGGAIGIILGILYFLYASLVTVVHLFHTIPVGSFYSGIVGIVVGILSIIAAGIARRDSLVGGIGLLIMAFIGFSFVGGGLYLIADVIVLVGGIVAIADYIK